MNVAAIVISVVSLIVILLLSLACSFLYQKYTQNAVAPDSFADASCTLINEQLEAERQKVERIRSRIRFFLDNEQDPTVKNTWALLDQEFQDFMESGET
jgi:hypothetical protein